jgi:hypothetical protein
MIDYWKVMKYCNDAMASAMMRMLLQLRKRLEVMENER